MQCMIVLWGFPLSLSVPQQKAPDFPPTQPHPGAQLKEILAQQPLWEVRGRRRAELEVTTTLCTLLKYVCTPMHCGCWIVIVMQDTRELKG